jgi:hypothetical protein
MTMAIFEVTVVAIVAKLGLGTQTFGAIAAVGAGGGLGALAAMWLHGKMFPRPVAPPPIESHIDFKHNQIVRTTRHARG